MTEWEAMVNVCDLTRRALERRSIGHGFVAIRQEDKDAIHVALNALDAAEVVSVEDLVEEVARCRFGIRKDDWDMASEQAKAAVTFNDCRLTARAVLARIKGGAE